MTPLPMTPSLELLLTGRVIAAAIAGALIGYEREVHAHPAGLRTHIMVALGSATFAILSMHGFGDVLGQKAVVLDPSRVAAGIVAGIGFIGGGAILKYGPSVRGLTTAASLWATAAVGFAFGAGMLILGTGVCLLILVVLGPFNALVARLRARHEHQRHLRLNLSRLEAMSEVYSLLRRMHVDVSGIESHRLGKGHYEVDLDLVMPAGASFSDLVVELSAFDAVDVIEVSHEDGY